MTQDELFTREKIAGDLNAVLAVTGALWPSLAGGRMFITGGTGFFGKWLLAAVCRANEQLGSNIEVTVLSRNPEGFSRRYPALALSPGISFIKGDVRDFAFPGGEFTHVIHGAADASAKINNENPLLMYDTITQGTRRVLDFAVQANVRRFLLISSGAVYGSQPPNVAKLTEDYPGAPDVSNHLSAYGEAKRAAELLANLYRHSHGLPVVTARCFAFVGPLLSLNSHFAIGNFIGDGLAGRPIVIKGDGTPLRSYMYASDLVVWLLTLLLQGKPGRAYNVGSDKAVSIADLAREVSRAFSVSPEVIVKGASIPGAAPERYVPDISRARDELGLDVTVSLPEAIARTIRWYQ